MEKVKLFKVWNYDKKEGYLLYVNKLEELKVKGQSVMIILLF